MAQALANMTRSSDLRVPLVGRDPELIALRDAYELVENRAEPQVVTLLGGAGTGKSRLIEEHLLKLQASGKLGTRVYRGRSRSQGLSYGVFSRLLRARFGIAEGTPVEAAQAQLRAQVARVLDDRKVGDVCYFLAQLMGLPFQQSPFTRAMGDDAQQARIVRRGVLRSFFEKDAANAPLCLVFEDLHFADEDSVELLLYLFDNLRERIMILCAARPELLSRHPEWFRYGTTRHQRLELGPLNPDQAAEIAKKLLAPCEGGPPDALVEAAIGIASGNPGLLEGMVRIFHDSGVLQELSALAEEPRWRVDLDKLASVRLPLTVEDAVALRIAALSPSDRHVLEHAASMGSVFWLGALVTLSRMERDVPEYWAASDHADRDEIQAVLDDLTRRDYVLRLPDSAFADDAEYVFKHNLEREKVAALTSAAARQGYHQTIADWLAQKAHVRSQEEYCAMLARHLEQAGSLTRAGLTFLEAGDIARSHFAAKKAQEYYSKGLSVLGTDDARRRVDALHNYGDVLLMLGKTDESLASFREMHKVAFRFGLTAKGGAAHNRIGRLYRDIGSLSLARRHLDTSLELFEAVGDERGIAASNDDIGTLLWIKGEYEASLKHLKHALEIRKTLNDRRSIALSLNNIGRVWMDDNRDAEAAEALEAALKIRREIGDSLGVVQSLNNLGRLALDQNRPDRALELFREAYEVAMEIGERNRSATVLTNMGDAHQRLGNTTEAIRLLKQAEELCDELGDKLNLAEAKRGLAKAYLAQRELMKARQSIKHAVDLFGQVRSKVHLAAALRTLGEVTGAGAWGEGHEVKAVDYFMRSIAIAKEIGNELEVAHGYRAFAEYVTSSPHYRKNTDIQREAKKLGEMATEIFERHRIASLKAK